MPEKNTNRNTDKLLLLVDGSSYLFRAFHALPPLTNSKGQPTGAIYGVLNMLKRLIKDYAPDQVAVVFDAPGKTFRDTLFEAYKSHRPPMPDDLRCQIEPLHGVVRALGLPLLCVPGVEADDVIGTLARQAARQGLRVVISTGDKDMTQLVDDHITLVNTMSDTTLDRAGVIAKFGVPPEQIIDYLALIGDTSDNIPGIPKVGPKTAAKWLSTYGSAENLIAHADEVPGKIGEILREHKDAIPLSRALATIKVDVSLNLTHNDLIAQPVDEPRLRDWYERLEFKTWLRQLDETSASTPALDVSASSPERSATSPDLKNRYETVTSMEQLMRWNERLHQASFYAVDLETTSLNYMDAQIVGIAITDRPGSAAYIPVAHRYLGAPDQLDRDAVLNVLKPMLEDDKPHKIGQHIKYDMNVLGNYGITLKGIAFDTMLESYVLDSTANRHDMDTLAEKYLDYRTIHYEDVTGKGKDQIPFECVEIEQATAYAGEDADVTLRLHETFLPRIASEPKLLAVLTELEIPLIPVLSAMERRGVFVDAQKLHAQSKELANRLQELEEQAIVLAGMPFNLSSPKQIQDILYTKLGLPVREKTPTGQPSTAESVLQELALDFPLPKLILEYRGLSKLKSTYTDKLPQQINARTGRVHTSYHQAVAATGRLSSSDPNLQNIPIRTEEGRRIRQAFIAPDGCRIIAADYSQIELRIMAHLSGDEGLLRAFRQGEDIHRATAAEMFSVPVKLVTNDQRRSAKAINFGLIYGMSSFGLARQLGIDRTQAQSYIDRYFQRYPGVKTFMEQTREQARARRYVETVFGRRLYTPDIDSRNSQRRQGAERAAINAPMQGTAADIIKRAMIGVHSNLMREGLAATMIMQVHDELVFEVSEDHLERACHVIVETMTAAAQLSVPLEVQIGTGANWDEAH